MELIRGPDGVCIPCKPGGFDLSTFQTPSLHSVNLKVRTHCGCVTRLKTPYDYTSITTHTAVVFMEMLTFKVTG